MRNKTALIYLSVASIIFYELYTLWVKNQTLSYADLQVTHQIQDFVSRKLDTFLSVFSLVGSFEISIILLLVILLMIKKLRSFFVLAIFMLGHLIEYFSKLLLYHPRPPHEFSRYSLPFHFPSSGIQTGSSYPSGHTFRTIFISVLVFYLIYIAKKNKINRKILITLLLVFNIIMLVSRVSLGEHWLTDVAGGFLLGLALGLISIFVVI